MNIIITIDIPQSSALYNMFPSLVHILSYDNTCLFNSETTLPPPPGMTRYQTFTHMNIPLAAPDF